MKGINRCIVGGRYLDSYVPKLLERQGFHKVYAKFRLNKTLISFDPHPRVFKVEENTALGNVHPSFESYMNLELGRDLKENVCRMADYTLNDSDPRFKNVPSLPYELPDGTVVHIGIERFQLPELFIDPVFPTATDVEYGNNKHTICTTTATTTSTVLPTLPAKATYLASCESLPKLISDSVLRSDVDIQSSLLANMVLTGGSSAFEGMADRLRFEVDKIVHNSAPHWKVKLLSIGNNEKTLSTWLGGSILGSLGSFHDMWISRVEYEEFGCAIVDRKCH
jgi:actin-like protein 6A